MTSEYFFKLFAAMQGAFLLGLVAFVFLYYTSHYKNTDNRSRRLLKIGFCFSYIMLTIATIRTALYSIYQWGDLWYWITIAGYIISDICIIYLFRLSIRKQL